jgi:hypothetical protein
VSIWARGILWYNLLLDFRHTFGHSSMMLWSTIFDDLRILFSIDVLADGLGHE